MASIIKILDVCKTKDLNFEDADYKFLQNKVKTMKWGKAHKDIVEFVKLFE